MAGPPASPPARPAPSGGTAPDASPKMPPQIGYIIGNEGCERFSFYGMRNVLTTFLVGSLLLDLPEADREGAAKEVFHTFVIGVYFFPLLGGFLADRYLGYGRTISLGIIVMFIGYVMLVLPTAMNTATAPATPSARSVVKLSRPAATFLAISASRPGS